MQSWRRRQRQVQYRTPRMAPAKSIPMVPARKANGQNRTMSPTQRAPIRNRSSPQSTRPIGWLSPRRLFLRPQLHSLQSRLLRRYRCGHKPARPHLCRHQAPHSRGPVRRSLHYWRSSPARIETRMTQQGTSQTGSPAAPGRRAAAHDPFAQAQRPHCAARPGAMRRARRQRPLSATLRSLPQASGRLCPLRRNCRLPMRRGDLRRRRRPPQPARMFPAIFLRHQGQTTLRIPNSAGVRNHPQCPTQPHPAQHKPASTRRRIFRSKRRTLPRLEGHRTTQRKEPSPSRHTLPLRNLSLSTPRLPRCGVRLRLLCLRRRHQVTRRSRRLRLRLRLRKIPSPRSIENPRWELLHGPTQAASTLKPVFAIPILDGWACAPI